ncbi:MAG TPA: biotin/lipoyl-containing protein, partial [Solirubrobacterales bacterium]|nr:biotin/lipoyl-containing protein [Solirubrobacterales bacterium]
MADVVMPRLSDSMEEGTVLAWMKSIGDEVAVGDELVEIETDKANMVYESDVAGTLVEILADEGATLPIGEVIARVGDAGDAPAPDSAGDGGEPAAEPTAATPAAAADEAPAAEPSTPAPTAPEPQRRTDGERLKASPLARRIAAERNVDLAALSGSGPG